MSFLKRPFYLGALKLSSNVFYAPLAGCSDFAFRQMSKKYNPGLIFCEMVKMDALIRHNRATFDLLEYSSEMHPIGAQICGSKPEIAGSCAKIIEDLGFDVIDLNCGCPVDKVTKDGSGSGLLRTPQLIGDILSEMKAAVNIPITVKIRSGWTEEELCASLITEIAQEAGACAISVHGRTRAQKYRGPANWEWIRQSKEVADTILVIGNGDVMDPLSAEQMFQTTGCDAVLVSRGTLGQPWIAEDISRHLSNLPPIPRSSAFRREELKTHFTFKLAQQGERQAVIEMRRVGCWYIKKSAKTKEFRFLMSRVSSAQEVHQLLDQLDEEFL